MNRSFKSATIIIAVLLLLTTIHQVNGQKKSGQKKSQGRPNVAEKKEKSRLIDRGSYVIDTKTRLVWQKDGMASGKKNFYEAKKYAEKLQLGSLKNWRVPTGDELRSIFPAAEKPFTRSGYNPNRIGQGARREDFRSYWTSELDQRIDDYAYVYHWYAKGGKNNGYASRNYCYVRCVHELPKEKVTDEEKAMVAQWVKDLGSSKYSVRSRASQELQKISWRVIPLLKQHLKQTESPEARKRLKQLIENRNLRKLP